MLGRGGARSRVHATWPSPSGRCETNLARPRNKPTMHLCVLQPRSTGDLTQSAIHCSATARTVSFRVENRRSMTHTQRYVSQHAHIASPDDSPRGGAGVPHRRRTVQPSPTCAIPPTQREQRRHTTARPAERRERGWRSCPADPRERHRAGKNGKKKRRPSSRERSGRNSAHQDSGRQTGQPQGRGPALLARRSAARSTTSRHSFLTAADYSTALGFPTSAYFLGHARRKIFSPAAVSRP